MLETYSEFVFFPVFRLVTFTPVLAKIYLKKLVGVELSIKCCGLLNYSCYLSNYIKYKSCRQCINLKINFTIQLILSAVLVVSVTLQGLFGICLSRKNLSHKFQKKHSFQLDICFSI